MAKTLHVTFDGEVLRPEESMDLEPNASYIITIEQKEPVKSQSLWSVLNNLTGTVEGPTDWSEEHDHYLYGTLKKNKVD